MAMVMKDANCLDVHVYNTRFSRLGNRRKLAIPTEFVAINNETLNKTVYSIATCLARR